jgi:hypothetical protein
VNVLANRALRRFVEWDSRAEKLGLMGFAPDLMAKLLEPYTVQQAKELGRWAGKENMLPMTLYVFGSVSLDSVLKSVDFISKYMGRFTSEYVFREGKHHLTLRHGMGMKWSVFYAASAEEVLGENLGMEIVSTVTDDACFLEFKPKDARSAL